jgi:spore germination protein
MQIHVVKPGDTIFEIAKQYNASTSAIISANELEEPSDLVIGQSLVIPIVGQYYSVQPGDTLSTIGKKFNVTAKEIASVNNININKTLNIGERLYIPTPANKPRIEVNAYVEPFGETVSEALERSARQASPFLTYLAPFSYRITREGTLIAPPLNNFYEIARMNRATLMMVVTNLEEGAFSSELGNVILSSEELQNKLLTNIINTALEKGFKDIHFDFEFLLPTDREKYNQFLVKARDRIHDANLLISTALAPKISGEQEGPWYTAHDYPFHGKTVDFVVLMTYEWGYSGGPAMPVSPINEVEKVIKYAASVMPTNKIMLGQNLYGYDWTLPFKEGTYAKAISPQQGITLARKYNVAIQYDETAEAPHFDYYDEEGKRHKVWFEDARSIQSKFDLINQYQLRGISYWKLGLSFPQNWLLLDDNFDIIKRI